MISKRTKRPARPQENLRQFALNSSRGVNITTPPTDSNTVAYSKNLVINLDGSVSVRKPITCIENTISLPERRRHVLYDANYAFVWSTNGDYAKVVSASTGNPVSTPLRYTNYKGDVCKVNVTDISKVIDFSHVEPININSATILGNCTVDATYSLISDYIDPAFDASTVKALPRYIRIFNDYGVMTLEIVSPEPNTLTTAEGDVPLNPNMLLDNPTAVRDSYGCTVPSCKGILAYTPKDRGDAIKFESGGRFKSISNSTSIRIDTLGKEFPVAGASTVNLSSSDTNYTDSSVSLSCAFTVHSTGEVEASVSSTFTGSNIPSASLRIIIDYHERGGNYPVLKSFETDVVVYPNTETQEYTLPEFDISDVEYVYVRVQAECGYVNISYSASSSVKIFEVTEKANGGSYEITSKISSTEDSQIVFLKAFCNLPTSNTAYYASWEMSDNGVSWEPLDTVVPSSRDIYVKEAMSNFKPNTNVEASSSNEYVLKRYSPLIAASYSDVACYTLKEGNNTKIAANRIDMVPVVINAKMPEKYYRFKIIAASQISNDDPILQRGEPSSNKYKIDAIVSQVAYTPVFGVSAERFTVELGNAAYGKKLYHKKAIYSYGSEKFFNNIFVSDIDSFITPLYNVIDLDTYVADVATCLVPWSDYLVSATPNAIYLHSKEEGGFLTKTVNTSIGIPKDDYRCCKAILNGILFKSGQRVYQMYPNMYAGDDSTLNLTEISKPVEDILEEYEVSSTYTPFAFSTDSEYILMLPHGSESRTTCLRYSYNSKRWTMCEYPIIALDYEMLDLNDVRIFGIANGCSAEFKFDDTSADTFADTLPISTSSTSAHPISFEWDTGQKTDNIALTRQFVESKLVFSTEDIVEYFPMELTVHVDGDPHVTTVDLNSDAPFWKTEDSKGVANTAFRLSLDDTSDTKVFRQLIVRYSGKGRTVRHILKGSATSNFRLYETYVRYKILNVKR